MTRSPADSEAPLWQGMDGLDRLLEHRARLGICVLLARNDSLSFSRLKSLLEETDGSLGTHLRKLEEAGYLAARKTFRERKPVTWYRLKPQGKRVLGGHLAALEELIRAAR